MRIILCGACGRMGRNVSSVASEKGEQIVCGVDLFPKEESFPVYPSFADIREEGDVVIDFSSPIGLKERLAYCEEHGLNIVLASTGYTPEDLALIDEYAKKIGIFKTGNFSLGINLLQVLVKKAAATLGDDFDVEIIERHHNKKKDAPSGTALMLAKSVTEGLEEEKTFVCGREGIVGERNKNEIGIHAVRGGTIVGEHEVMFAGEDEIITLSHSARSRKVFATGAVRAAAFMIGKPVGMYDMTDLFAEV